MINVPEIPIVGHSLYIQNLSRETGKTYRELEWLWNAMVRKVHYEQMMNPTSHTLTSKSDFFNRVGNAMEEYLKNPENAEIEEQTDELGDAWGDSIDMGMEGGLPPAPDMGMDMGMPTGEMGIEPLAEPMPGGDMGGMPPEGDMGMEGDVMGAEPDLGTGEDELDLMALESF